MFRCFWLLAAAVGLILSACEGPDEFLRANPSDPASDRFVPSAPEDLIATLQLGSILLQWGGGSEHADSVLIERASGHSEDVSRIAMLPGDATEYADDLGGWSDRVRYDVTLLKYSGNDYRPGKTKTTEVHVGRVEAASLSYHSTDSLRVTWENTTTIAESLAVLVAKNGELEEIGRVSITDDDATVPLVLDGLNDVNYYIRLVVDDESIAERIVALDARRHCRPRDASFSLLNERQVAVSWERACHLEGNFFIEQRDTWRAWATQSVSHDVTETVLNVDMTSGATYGFNVAMRYGGKQTVETSAGSYRHDIPAPEITNVEIDGNTIRIEWTHDTDLAYDYTIRRAIGTNLGQRFVARTASDVFEFEHTLDPGDGQYQYFVASRTSPPATIDISYRRELIDDVNIEMEEGESDFSAISPEQDLIATAGPAWASGSYRVHTVEGSLLASGQYSGALSAIAVSDVHELVALCLKNGRVEIRNFADEVVRAIQVDDPHRVTFSRSGRYLAIVDYHGGMWVYEVDDWSLKAHRSHVQKHVSPPGIAFSPDESEVWWSREIRYLQRYVLDPGSLRTPRPIDHWTVNPRFARDGSRLLLGTVLYDYPSMTEIPTPSSYESADLSSTGRYVAGFVPSGGGVLRVFDVEEQRMVAQPSVGQPRSLRFLSDDRIAMAMGYGRVRIVRLGEERWIEEPRYMP